MSGDLDVWPRRTGRFKRLIGRSASTKIIRVGSDLDDSGKTVESPDNLRVVQPRCGKVLVSYAVCQCIAVL